MILISYGENNKLQTDITEDFIDRSRNMRWSVKFTSDNYTVRPTAIFLWKYGINLTHRAYFWINTLKLVIEIQLR